MNLKSSTIIFITIIIFIVLSKPATVEASFTSYLAVFNPFYWIPWTRSASSINKTLSNSTITNSANLTTISEVNNNKTLIGEEFKNLSPIISHGHIKREDDQVLHENRKTNITVNLGTTTTTKISMVAENTTPKPTSVSTTTLPTLIPSNPTRLSFNNTTERVNNQTTTIPKNKDWLTKPSKKPATCVRYKIVDGHKLELLKESNCNEKQMIN